MGCDYCGYEGCDGNCDDGQNYEKDQEWLKENGWPTDSDIERARFRSIADDDPSERDSYIFQYNENPWEEETTDENED
jgi:hypothetical protein